MPKSIQFISKGNGMYKRDVSFRMNVMEQIFQIRSCIEILAKNIKVDTTDQYMLFLINSHRVYKGYKISGDLQT